ncbi:MAG: hypothetical protein ABI650_05255, partial [Dokdonella sp.]
ASLIVDGLRYLDNREALEVFAGADFTIARSEFRGNAPTVSGQPAALWIRNVGSNVVVEDSTFANNTGTSDTGGAVLVEGGAELSVRNSTFVNNTFSVAAAADGARGAAIGYRSDPADTVLTLQNVTIVAPTVAPVGLEGSALGGRGAGSDVLLNICDKRVRFISRHDLPGSMCDREQHDSTTARWVGSSSCRWNRALTRTRCSCVWRSASMAESRRHSAHKARVATRRNSAVIDVGVSAC